MDDLNLNRSIYLNPKNSGIQQIIGRVPPWLVLWGITICSCGIFIGLLICWQIRYSDVITVPIKIQSNNGPYPILNKTNGQLSQVLVSDDSMVLKDQAILYFDKDGDVGQFLKIDKILTSTKISDKFSLRKLSEISETDKLGTLQSDFDQLKNDAKRYMSVPSKKLLRTLSTELSVFRKKVAIWEDWHLRKTTFSGRIEYPRSPTLNKFYSVNEVLFYVVTDSMIFNAVLFIPKKFENKISAQSRISLKLSDFPSDQFGTIFGKINKLNPTNLNDSVFFATVGLEKSIYTSKGIKIVLNNSQQNGVADIELKRTRLLYKILHISNR